ncbi:TetR/AcrR family transcriptional regulator [Eggerthellaceae bacterium 3-80]
MSPRRENPNKVRIRKAAFVLMYEQGFSQTSYSAIAQKAEVSRSLVQRHYPKKDELLALFFNRIIAASSALLQERGKQAQNPVLQALHLLQLYLQIIIYNDNMQLITRESLASRKILTMLIKDHLDMIIACIDRSGEQTESEVFLAAIKAMGGMEALLLFELNENVSVDAGDMSAQMIAAVRALATDVLYQKEYESLRGQLLDPECVRRMAAEVLEEVLIP